MLRCRQTSWVNQVTRRVQEPSRLWYEERGEKRERLLYSYPSREMQCKLEVWLPCNVRNLCDAKQSISQSNKTKKHRNVFGRLSVTCNTLNKYTKAIGFHTALSWHVSQISTICKWKNKHVGREKISIFAIMRLHVWTCSETGVGSSVLSRSSSRISSISSPDNGAPEEAWTTVMNILKYVLEVLRLFTTEHMHRKNENHQAHLNRSSFSLH